MLPQLLDAPVRVAQGIWLATFGLPTNLPALIVSQQHSQHRTLHSQNISTPTNCSNQKSTPTGWPIHFSHSELYRFISSSAIYCLYFGIVSFCQSIPDVHFISVTF